MMRDAKTSQAVFKSSPDQLAEVLNFEVAWPNPWTEADLPAMFRHQMAAPIAFDLKTLARSETVLTEAAKEGIRTFENLLQHPHPPETLLSLAKDFFKTIAGPIDSRLAGQQVAYVFYLLAILVARERLGRSLTRLSDAELLRGVEWGATRTWIDAGSREIFLQARAKLVTKVISGGL
jgi:hypothetical protein